MAEQPQTTAELATTQVSSGGFLSTITNSMEKFKKFSNEPAVQRSIPVMIGLFVIFLGLVFFITFREPSRTTLFSSLPEHEKSRVVDVLRTNGIDVSIDKTTVISDSRFHRLNKWFKQIGVKVEKVNYSEISKLGGLFRCSTLPLIRKKT